MGDFLDAVRAQPENFADCDFSVALQQNRKWQPNLNVSLSKIGLRGGFGEGYGRVEDLVKFGKYNWIIG